ncbi:MAG: PilZ domain-containing protein [Phycisphaerales bacterium]|nr:PilZ domain-containing protein [Phycisphaerales bacterium]
MIHFDNAPAPKGPEHRTRGRIRCGDVQTNLGTVLDISSGGMRIQGRGACPPMGEVVDLKVQSLTMCVVVACRLVWKKRSGLFRWIYGFEFVSISDDQRKCLSEILRVEIGQMPTVRPGDFGGGRRIA